MRHFKKAFLNQPFRFNGAAVVFENVGNNTGVRKLEEAQEAALISELDKAADARRSGVQRISQEIHDDLKKNIPQVKPLLRPQSGLPPIRVQTRQSLIPSEKQRPQSAVESAGGVLPNPSKSASGGSVEPVKDAAALAAALAIPPNARPSHAPGEPKPLELRRARLSEVEAKVNAGKAPEQ